MVFSMMTSSGLKPEPQSKQLAAQLTASKYTTAGYFHEVIIYQ